MLEAMKYTKFKDIEKKIDNKDIFTGNSCKMVKFNNKYVIYSYETIIGVIKDNTIYINTIYFSRTTSKYTNILKSSRFEKIYIGNQEELDNI